MKKTFTFLLFTSFVGLFIMLTPSFLSAQTAGTMSITYTQTAVGSANKQVMAVWIENASGAFVKTRARYWGNGTNDHLPSWVPKCGQNTVDAITGATLKSTTTPTAFGVKTYSWDGTNVSAALVPDGDYVIQIESAYANPEPANNTHSFISSFTFTKGATASTITPTNPNLSAITITWTPSAVSIEENESTAVVLNVYPNPSTGVFMVNFKEEMNVAKIGVYSITGKLVYSEQLNQNIVGTKSIDLSELAAGIYILDVVNASGISTKSKLFINK